MLGYFWECMKVFRRFAFFTLWAILFACCSGSSISVNVTEDRRVDERPNVTCTDSVTISFEGGFQLDTVEVLLNGATFSEQVLTSNHVLSHAGVQRMPMPSGMVIRLKINGLLTDDFEWLGGWCQARIYKFDKEISVVFTNRVLVYF